MCGWGWSQALLAASRSTKVSCHLLTCRKWRLDMSLLVQGPCCPAKATGTSAGGTDTRSPWLSSLLFRKTGERQADDKQVTAQRRASFQCQSRAVRAWRSRSRHHGGAPSRPFGWGSQTPVYAKLSQKRACCLLPCGVCRYSKSPRRSRCLSSPLAMLKTLARPWLVMFLRWRSGNQQSGMFLGAASRVSSRRRKEGR